MVDDGIEVVGRRDTLEQVDLAAKVSTTKPCDEVAIDHEVGLRRMEQAGVVLTTSESLLFEWCQGAEHARFREVRSLITGK